MNMDNMHKENNSNSRSSFLKKLPLALVSVFGLSLIGLNLQRFQRFFEFNFKTISENEANKYISNMPFTKLKQLKPEPPPKFRQTSDGLKTN